MWKKLLPDMENDDLQGFPTKGISKSETDVCNMRSFQMSMKMMNNGCKEVCVNWASSTWTVSMLPYNKGEERGR
jgi:hypothetical protein